VKAGVLTALLVLLTSSPSLSQAPASSQIQVPQTPTSQVQIPVTPGVEPGHLTHKVEPEYPPKARDKQIEGNVVLDALIAKNGKVKDVEW